MVYLSLSSTILFGPFLNTLTQILISLKNTARLCASMQQQIGRLFHKYTFPNAKFMKHFFI